MALTKCCCCVDLLKGVKILGIVSLVLTILSAIASIVSVVLNGTGSHFGLFGFGLSAACDIMLILAAKERKRVLLLPWLVVVMISMIGSLIWICVWIYFGVATIQENDDNMTLAIIFFFVPVGVTCVILPIFGYFWAIVFSLYKLMGQEGNPYQATATNGIPLYNPPLEKF